MADGFTEDDSEPDPTDPDDQLAELVADRLVDLAAAGPGVFRLVALRMAGLSEGASQGTVAAAFGISRRDLRILEKRALAKLAHRFPELRGHLRK